jgi:pimeloyl-ACP methyl ester carboxylesterase
MPRSAPTPKYAAATPPPVVSGRWLLKGIGIVILVALVCSYLCLCLLYYVGQWQIVLHPDRAAQTQEAPPGLIRFGPDESGRPQLTGEWLSAGEGSRYGNLTVLLLPAGDGSRNDLQPIAHTLHNLGLNVFDFDYRGYGLSAAVHPSQQRMTEDSETAWRYLTASRNIPAGKIVPFGVGAGASLAARLAVEHPETPAVIFDRPHTDLLDFARADRRSSLLPAGLLFHENFPLATPLSTLTTPKLLIAKTGEPQPAFASAATPRMTIELPTDDGPLFQETLRRFLDQYAAQDK